MRPEHPWRWLILALIAVLLSAAALLYYQLTQAFRRGYETVAVIMFVEDYVKTHEGKWPTCWEDLENTETFERRGGRLSYYQRYTTVDFTLTSEQLIERPELIHHAIAPAEGASIGPPHTQDFYDAVLQAIRDARQPAVTP